MKQKETNFRTQLRGTTKVGTRTYVCFLIKLDLSTVYNHTVEKRRTVLKGAFCKTIKRMTSVLKDQTYERFLFTEEETPLLM